MIPDAAVDAAARLLSRNHPDSPPERTVPLVQALRERVQAVRMEREVKLDTAEPLDVLPELMKTRRDHLGLSMLAVANAVNVPMMTYRRFELGECDRLRLPHVASMLRWLEATKVIPEAAVEAAAMAVEFALQTDEGVRAIAREAIEAAAPHLLPDVWDEGNLAGKEASHRFERTNPYR